MKTNLLILLSVFFYHFASAQNRDVVWVLGSQFSGNNLALEFTNDQLDTLSLFHELRFLITDASICDTLGKLLFYTNGAYIANSNHDTLKNSKDYNPGYLTDEYYASVGLGIPQGAIIIPFPLQDYKYYVFSVSGDKIPSGTWYYTQPKELRYSIIDMELDNGLGAVMTDKKKITAIDDTICQGRITACKHANGRDWWVVVREHLSNKYYKLLVTPYEILVTEQEIGFLFNENDALGMAVFSPNGDYYAHLNADDTLQVMKFDRCTGEFSDPVLIPDLDTAWTLGCAFSPSGRFLYVSSYLHVYQIDMWATDIASSAIEVAYYQDVVGFPHWFALMQLAPDNKIYISTYSGTKNLHKIDQPDSLGMPCKVMQDAIVLPSYNTASLPNFANYDLGPLLGSACDTLNANGITQNLTDLEFRISPNPANGWINISYEIQRDMQFELMDIIGKRIRSISLFHYFKHRFLDVSQLPSGLYLATVTLNGERVWSEKIVIQ